MTMDNSGTIDALLQEDRRYEPSAEFKRAVVDYFFSHPKP